MEVKYEVPHFIIPLYLKRVSIIFLMFQVFLLL